MPDAAGRSLWLAAAWTGIGAAVIGATLGVLSVAIVWMPASGASGHWTSTVRAGLLTFLAALHGGVTVDGTDTHFLPLGLLVVVGCAAWRAGAVLADTAWSIDETDSVRLLVAGFAQTVAFTLSCLIAVPFAHLGTSSAPVLGVGCAAALLFSLTGGVAFVRWSALGGRLLARLPAMLPRCTRAAAAGLVAYVGFAALLVAGSLVVHHTRVTALSGQVGGGWAGVPILALGVLAAPNAVIAATSYLAGPGFAVGSGTVVGATGTAAHGVLPSFPLLGALPDGGGAASFVWPLLVAAPLIAGFAVAGIVRGAGGFWFRVRDAVLSAALAGLAMAVLAWQGGGSIGGGRLATIGASPSRVGLALGVALAVCSTAVVCVGAAWRRIRPAHTGSSSLARIVGPSGREAAKARLVAVGKAVQTTAVQGKVADPANTAEKHKASEKGKATEKGKRAG